MFAICANSFWNNFCKPRYPGIHIILTLVLLDTVFTCVVVLMSTYYDNYSDLQHFGYFTMLCANIISMVAGFLAIHFLTLNPKRLTLSYCIFLHVALALAAFLCIVTFSLMGTSPSVDDIQRHTSRYVKVYHKAPYMMGNTFREKGCCGITKFGDFFTELERRDDAENKIVYYRVPELCCKSDPETISACKQSVGEGKLVTAADLEMLKKSLFDEACFKNDEGYSSLFSTKTYATYSKTKMAGLGSLLIVLGILVVLNYYIWIVFRKSSNHQKPTEFNEDLKDFMKFRWCHLRRKTSLRRSIEDNEKSKKVISQFVLRHELMKQSLAHMRNQHRDAMERQQKEKQLDSTTKITPTIPVVTP